MGGTLDKAPRTWLYGDISMQGAPLAVHTRGGPFLIHIGVTGSAGEGAGKHLALAAPLVLETSTRKCCLSWLPPGQPLKGPGSLSTTESHWAHVPQGRSVMAGGRALTHLT